MSIDIANRGRGVFYLNFRQVQDASGTAVCRATQEFNYGNLLEKSGDHVVAVERVIIPIHRLLAIPALVPAFTFAPVGAGVLFTVDTPEAFSIKFWIDAFNAATAGLAGNIFMSINQSGLLQIQYDGFANFSIGLHPTIQAIFDSGPGFALADADADGRVYSTSSVADRFDQVYKVQLEIIGMSVVNEIINTQRTLPVLTDFLIPENFSFSFGEDSRMPPSTSATNITYPIRQSIVYNAQGARRFIMLRGNSPVQNLTMQAVAIFKDGTRNDILLPRNAIFEAKLGFYHK